MRWLFPLLMLLYPRQFRAEFETEMQSVLLAVLAGHHSPRQWAWVLWGERGHRRADGAIAGYPSAGRTGPSPGIRAPG